MIVPLEVRMSRLSVLLLSLFLLTTLPRAQTPASQTPPAHPAGLDVRAIDGAIGKSGQTMGDVYRVSFPRSDLSVMVGDVKIKPGLALGSWAAFKSKGSGNAAVVHGDLVLTDAEMNPVISGLQQHDFSITAVHNHLTGETPRVMYVHYWGEGPAATLAASLKDALGRSKTPIAAPAPSASAATADDLPAERIQEAIGLKGTVSNGVLALSQPRPETIQMMGVTLPPAMGMATAINFQSAGSGRVATTGDFVMIADEVNKVARALRQHDIEITALHNHMLHGSPELYFMHFWAVGDATKIASGLKAALDQLKKS
jgi:Domain of Unknown Function (DUF1259)